jgi:hypothetical protein
MVMVAVVVVLASVPPSVEQRGEGPPIDELRSRARPSFAFAPGVSLVPWERGPAAGAGALLETGLIFSDRFALSFHFEATLLLPTETSPKPPGLLLLGGATLDWFLNDRWSFGGGVLGGYFVGAYAPMITTPLRANFRVTAREATARSRMSLMVGLQAGPGLMVGAVWSVNPVNVIGSGMLTVGVGWW